MCSQVNAATEKRATSGEMDQYSAPFALKHVSSDTTLFFNFSPSLIGRNEKKCHLILNHHSISRIHCALFWSESELFISDLGSRNGVFVNQRRTRCKKLKYGDEIQVGKFQFEFVEIVNQVNEEAKQESNQSNSDQEIGLNDLAIAPPAATQQDRPINANQVKTADLDGDIELTEIDDDELVKRRSNYYDDEDEDDDEDGAVSTYQLDATMLAPEITPILKQIKTSDSEVVVENWRDAGIVNYTLNHIKKASWQKRISYAVVFLIVLFALKLVLFSGNSDYKIYAALQTKLNTVQSLRANSAGPIKWQILAANSSSEFQPIISSLEREASTNDRVKQELLLAARDCLPRVYEESQDEVGESEKRLIQHLENVRLILENGSHVEAEINENNNTQSELSSN